MIPSCFTGQYSFPVKFLLTNRICLISLGLSAGLTRHVEQDRARVYNVYSACAAEAEVDILTGNCHIRRADLVFDCGERSEHLATSLSSANVNLACRLLKLQSK